MARYSITADSLVTIKDGDTSLPKEWAYHRVEVETLEEATATIKRINQEVTGIAFDDMDFLSDKVRFHVVDRAARKSCLIDADEPDRFNLRTERELDIDAGLEPEC